MINRDRGVLFCHVPKNAGTSIEAALEASGGYSPPHYPPVTLDRHMTWKGGESERILRHIERHTWDRCFKFAIVRNPWDRLVSAWEFTRNRKRHSVSFPEFVGMLLDLDLRKSEALWPDMVSIRWHTMPQVDHISLNGGVAVDFIGRMETLEDDWEAICVRTGCNMKLSHRNRGVHEPYQAYYTSELAERVAQLFKRDIESFGYEF
jgi:hypothetical protein